MTPQVTVASHDTPDHLERHELELNVLATISSLMTEQTGQHRMLSRVLDQLQRRLDVMSCTARLVTPDGAELVVEAPPGVEHRDRRVADHRQCEGIIAAVVQTGQPATVVEIVRMPRFLNQVDQCESGETGFLCVPIVLDNDVVGTLWGYVAKHNTWLLEEHVRVFEIVANMIAADVRARRSVERDRHALQFENQRLRGELRRLEKGLEQDKRESVVAMLPVRDAPAGPRIEDPQEASQFVSLTSRVALLEKEMIVDALKVTRGNVAAAARLLEITPRIIRYKILKLGIESGHFCGKRES